MYFLNVGLYLKNMYEEQELDENTTLGNFPIVQKEGSREVKRTIDHYNLQAIISIGFKIENERANQYTPQKFLRLKK